MKYDKILFLSHDNSTTGPMAEAIFKNICKLPELTITARGAVVLFETPINPKVEVVLGSHGLTPVSGTTRPLTEKDFTSSTLVLAIGQPELEFFRERYPLINAARLNEFVGAPEITDPHGGSLIDYENCFAQLSVMLKKLEIMIEEQQQ
ncbi:MAG: hypothetical protein K5848_08055 [Lachnospiraceae bacterium]|nr:hypothetical protein [Lachnospiraceae bacterium]